jgi:4-hydroxybenzoate polyprenyltransferase
MPLSARVLTVLQFTRAALVFTAIADVLTATLLAEQFRGGGGGGGGGGGVRPMVAGLAVAMSCCLYGFGMALNDLVDRRKDALLAASRPLPSGRLGVSTAHAIVAVLGTGSLVFAALLAMAIGGRTGVASFVLAVLTLGLINFYNFAGKYLVSAGLLTLGAVRLVHATIAAPELPVVWHPLWLFTHVIVVSAVAYVWEEKRPRVTPLHAVGVSLGVVGVNVAVVAWSLAMKLPAEAGIGKIPAAMSLTPWLAVPFVSTFAFAVVAWRIGRSVGGAARPQERLSADGEAELEALPLPLRTRRKQAGRQLVLAGLLWLIVHDAAFVFAYVGAVQAGVVLMLLPLAYAGVRLMRWWGELMALKERPRFRMAKSL